MSKFCRISTIVLRKQGCQIQDNGKWATRMILNLLGLESTNTLTERVTTYIFYLPSIYKHKFSNIKQSVMEISIDIVTSFVHRADAMHY
jgi:hypothetical protein